ncbi:MAG: 50S ribosomal protein L25 [Candidatus Omnitrophota bacterium]|nr:50S ribosomal protein L25 [Candidatus Omnitrophota bacterium]
MKEVVLNVDLREDTGTGKSRSLRKAGFIPCVVYGGKKSRALKITRSELLKFLREHKGENVIIDLKISGDSKAEKENTVMIKEMQQDPVSEEVIHIDFNRISLTKTISVKVPVSAKGEAVGVKSDGGILEHVLWEIEIECLPKDLPKSIEVDVANMKIGDAIHVKDIKLPEKIKVKHDPDTIVLSVAPPSKEEAAAPEAALGATAAAEPEVIKEKKKEEAEDKEAKPKAQGSPGKEEKA